MLNVPDEKGHYGDYGGRYVPETLFSALEELESAYRSSQQDSQFQQELARRQRDFCGRPTPLFFAERLTAHCGGAKI